MSNQVPKPKHGHQLDANTLMLYKMGDTQESQYTGGLPDEEALNNLIAIGAADELPITWGPAGNTQRGVFARWFDGDTANHFRTSAVLGSGSALRQHIVEGGGEYTIEILARSDTSSAGLRGLTGIIGDAASDAPAENILSKISINPSNGVFEFVWERGIDNHIGQTSSGDYTNGEWFVVHFVMSNRSSTAFNVEIFLSNSTVTAKSIGTFTEAADFLAGDGTKPSSIEGTNAHLYVGIHQPTLPAWLGAIGSMRYVASAMTPGQVTTAATELLSTGRVTDGLTSLSHWNMNERPSIVDESPHGFHLRELNSDNIPLSGPGFDIVGTGGRARRLTGAVMKHGVDDTNFQTVHGRQLISFFNDDVDTIPEYTLEAWIVLPAQGLGTGTYRAWTWGPGGTSSTTNTLFRHSLTSALETEFFAEHGAGTDITQSPANTQILGTGAEPSDQYGRIHWAVRVRDVTSTFTIEHFINGVLKATHTIANTPTGGEGTTGDGLRLGDWDGWVQDIRISKGARTDQEILDSANNCGITAGGSSDTTAPTVTVNSPTSGTQISRHQPISFTVTDVVPGVLITGVWIKYKFDSKRVLVYDGDNFKFPFDTFSTVTDLNTDQTQLDFSIRPLGGWAGEIEQLQVRAADGGGNIDLGATDGIFFLAP